MRTREGNPVWPPSAPIRNQIRGNSQSICANCVHVADLCKSLRKEIVKAPYTQVIRCDGFEPIRHYEFRLSGRAEDERDVA